MSLLAIALASSGAIALAVGMQGGGGPAPAPSGGGGGGGGGGMYANVHARFGGHLETESLSVDLTATAATGRLAIRPGPNHIDSFFDVFFDITYQGKEEHGSWTIDSFFDVFFDITTSDPGNPGPEILQIRESPSRATGVIPLGSSGLELELDSFFDVFAEVSGDPSTGTWVTTFDSFFDIYCEVSAPPPEPGQPRTSLVEYGAEDGLRAAADPTTAKYDSFFDVLAGSVVPPGGGGSVHMDSFFDIFTEVSSVTEPNTRIAFDASQDGSTKVRPGPKDGPARVDVRERAAGRIRARTDMIVLNLDASHSGRWAGTLAEGTTPLPGDSFFDIFLELSDPRPRPFYAPTMGRIGGSAEKASEMMADTALPDWASGGPVRIEASVRFSGTSLLTARHP